jgi:hypothetical protein
VMSPSASSRNHPSLQIKALVKSAHFAHSTTTAQPEPVTNTQLWCGEPVGKQQLPVSAVLYAQQELPHSVCILSSADAFLACLG